MRLIVTALLLVGCGEQADWDTGTHDTVEAEWTVSSVQGWPEGRSADKFDHACISMTTSGDVIWHGHSESMGAAEFIDVGTVISRSALTAYVSTHGPLQAWTFDGGSLTISQPGQDDISVQVAEGCSSSIF